MRIGVDARAAAEERGGRGTVVRELLRAWQRADGDDEYLLYARAPWSGEPLDERFRWLRVGAPDPLWHVRAAHAANSACDVFLSTNSYLTAWFLRVPSVVVVHDMVAWDPELRPQRRAGMIERATLPLATRRATAFECVSESTARDLADRYPVTRPRTAVARLAADARFTPTGPREDLEGRPYVLGVGTLEPRKNLPRLIEAFAGLPSELRGNRLLALAGPLGWETDETLAALHEHRGLVHSLGFVSDERLPALYRSADAFAYPSLYEGFGLPVLEAMACGTPVVTSNVSSLPEVGGEAAAYVDPHDVASIRDELAAVLGDPDRRERMAAAGLRQAAAFSWDRFAAETRTLLVKVAGDAGT